MTNEHRMIEVEDLRYISDEIMKRHQVSYISNQISFGFICNFGILVFVFLLDLEYSNLIIIMPIKVEFTFL